MTGHLFLLVVVFDNISHCLLEMERTHLHLRVKKAVDEDAGVEVLLGVDAEVLVLGHDLLVHVADEAKCLVGGILVAVYFVSHHTLSRAGRSEPLHEEEVRTVWS